METISSVFAKYQPAHWEDLRIYLERINSTTTKELGKDGHTENELHSSDYDNIMIFPENILSNHMVDKDVYIIGNKYEGSKINGIYYKMPQLSLVINPNAFNVQPARFLTLSNLNMNATKDYGFLQRFPNLTQLKFRNVRNMDLIEEWAKLLPVRIPRNDELQLTETDSTDRHNSFNGSGNNETHFAENGLEELVLDNTWLSESTLRRILKGLLYSSSDTLYSLDISCNKLTEIPEEIKYFRSLVELTIKGHADGYEIQTIKAESLQHPFVQKSENWEEIRLEDIGLKLIEEGTFVGKPI